MNHRLTLIKITCLAGAVIDALAIIPMLSPQLGGLVLGIKDFHPGVEYRYAMYTAAALMLGWTGLLVWAFFSPVERRAVMLLTGVPVVLGLIAAGVYGVAAKFISLSSLMPFLLVQALLLSLFLVSYRMTGGARRERDEGRRAASPA